MKIKEKVIPYNRQSINKDDIALVTKALKEDIITRGKYVETFEKDLAKYCNAEYAVAFNSGTSALLAACFAAGIKRGDRIISTPNTFVSTVGAAVHCGGTPVFVDIDLTTGNLNIEYVEANVNEPITRGRNVVMPVHFSGIAVDMHALEETIATPETVVIEDAAHALGSSYPTGEKVGCCEWSDMTIFSFHPVKNITTGEGGMVTTNNKNYYESLKLCRNNGMKRGFDDPWYYEVEALTGNLNMTDFQAALGISQLKRLDTFVEKRRSLVKKYRELLASNDKVTLFTDAFDENTAFHLFVVQIDFKALGTTRTEVMLKLEELGVGSQYHYIPVYRHPVFKNMIGSISEYFPNMEQYYAEALSLPLFVDMDDSDVELVVKALNQIL